MFLLTRFSPARAGRLKVGRGPRAGARSSPRLEILEDRTLLNNRFVVPVGVIPDNVTTFASLQAALTTSGLSAGDAIQIEPGSAPGNIANANLPAVANLTIQGDAGVSAAQVPAFTVTDAVTVGSSQAGFTLRNVNVMLQGGGLTFSANGTIVNSVITDNFAGTALTLNQTTAAAVTNSAIVANQGAANGQVILVNAAAGSNNLISGNTVVSNAPVNHSLFNYTGPSATSDRVVNNTFMGNSGFAGQPLFVIGTGVNGLTVANNTFRDSDTGQTALSVNSNAQNLTLSGNTITLTGASGTVGISVLGGGTGTMTSLTIANNQIDTGGNGTGLLFTPGSGGTFTARAEGNDFHTNKIGVQFAAGGGGSVTGIDLGGGSQGSRGGNNFRGFTATATSSSGAIVVAVPNASGPINARSNLFAVSDPETVVFDANDTPSLADVVESGNITGNAAFVQALYQDFLKRTGDLSNPNDAGGFVNQLNGGAPPGAIANEIIRSQEGLTVLVNSLYRRFLNRDADPGGQAGFVNYLRAGGRLEGVIAALVSSPEYRNLFSSDAAFVQSLYNKLLNRVASSAEIANWLNVLPVIGRPGVAMEFLASPEYRGMVIQQYYSQLLHRPSPTASEVNSWVNSPLDLLSIEVQFAATGEFQANG
jgi:hypothetical protein